ncbi:MAG: 30S ribosomal protein S8 [Candidatus Hydrogenedentes bacterium]|nr:30S ribosomal protein S8 [Candidatus Hydrogenedentota bacterium]
MSMSDPIADLLTRMRNAIHAEHATVDIPASKLKQQICRVLKEEGFIADFTVADEPLPGSIRVYLKYTRNREPVIQGLRRVSKPSLRKYKQADQLRLTRSGVGISILTTSEGVMTSKHARSKKIGGEVICEVW